ncbi:aminoglycoside phosphotransferase family protein [Micromonospora andamanensis]
MAKVTDLARWFTAIDAPTIQLAAVAQEPMVVGSLLASVWTYVPPTPPAPTVEDLGAVLREFHSLPAPPIALPEWDPIGDARRRLADAEGLSQDEYDFLSRWCDRLEPQVTALMGQVSPRLVHGDAHVGNLLREPSGRVVMCDFDATCLGPWQVDLAAVAVGEVRFGGVGNHARLAAAYGFDVVTDPWWPLLHEARELKMIAAATPLMASSSAIRAEFRWRVRSVQSNDHDARWTPFADLATPAKE